MSEADRVSPGAASAEAWSSRLASTGHKRDGRMPFGVKGKLFLAFASLAMLIESLSANTDSISTAVTAKYYPVSFAQRRLWVIDQFEEAKASGT